MRFGEAGKGGSLFGGGLGIGRDAKGGVLLGFRVSRDCVPLLSSLICCCFRLGLVNAIWIGDSLLCATVKTWRLSQDPQTSSIVFFGLI